MTSLTVHSVSVLRMRYFKHKKLLNKRRFFPDYQVVTPPRNKSSCPKNLGLRSQWNKWHPWQLKKEKDSTANPTHLPKKKWPNWQCCLAGSSKTSPRILFFSIVLGAECSFHEKSIASYNPQFFGYYNSVLAIV